MNFGKIIVRKRILMKRNPISQCGRKDLMEIAWEQILKNPDKYRYGNSDYDNEEIMNYNLQRI